jgi:hypothetical protein
MSQRSLRKLSLPWRSMLGLDRNGFALVPRIAQCLAYRFSPRGLQPDLGFGGLLRSFNPRFGFIANAKLGCL